MTITNLKLIWKGYSKLRYAFLFFWNTSVCNLQVQAFFENQSEATFRLRCVQEALEVIQLNMQWVEKNLKTLTYWL